MTDIENQKKKLEQKKNRLAMEETKLKIQERKMRTRLLIEHGGLITKAGLGSLPTNALYGALLSLKKQLKKDDRIMAEWSVSGNNAFNKEKKAFTPVILKFVSEPEKALRDLIRSLGMRFNKFRCEWYGQCKNVDTLKQELAEIDHELEIIEDKI